MVATIKTVVYILPLLFAAAYSHEFNNAHKDFLFLNKEKLLGPHELFGNPFGNPNDYKKQKVPDDFGTQIDFPLPPPTKNNQISAGLEESLIIAPQDGDKASAPVVQADAPVVQADAPVEQADAPVEQAEFQVEQAKDEAPAGAAGGRKAGPGQPKAPITQFPGSWELVSPNSGVSAMHSILLPRINKVLMYDATIWKISNVKLPNGICRVLNPATNEQDCWAHSVLYDINNGQLTPLELHTDTWCSSGGLTVDGNFVSTGGFQGGANTVRYLDTCPGCKLVWREYPTALADRRWYSTQCQLPDGSFIVVGGREAFSFEYIPAEGQSNKQAIAFPFLKETSDKDENNLYPFVHLSTDGNIFIMANNRSILLSPKTNQIVRELPVLPGGHRSYPPSGMSVLLPLKLHAPTDGEDHQTPAEVLVCGGSAHIDSYAKAEKGVFYTALQDCGRIRITDKNPVWKRELMPTPRIMGDMMILPTGNVLLLNGATRGASGWGFAREPNLKPALYDYRGKLGKRFVELEPSTIPRMYHSSSVVLPDGKVLVSGSNTNNGYIYDAMFPTELRVEKFSPPYLDPQLQNLKPEIVVVADKLQYGQAFKVQIKAGEEVLQEAVQVTLYAPAFTTHGVNMNQRLIDLGLNKVTPAGAGLYDIETFAPPSGVIAPPGFYMMYVVNQGVPSISKWVQIR